MRNSVSEVLCDASCGVPTHASAFRMLFAPHLLRRPWAPVRRIGHVMIVRRSSVVRTVAGTGLDGVPNTSNPQVAGSNPAGGAGLSTCIAALLPRITEALNLSLSTVSSADF